VIDARELRVPTGVVRFAAAITVLLALVSPAAPLDTPNERVTLTGLTGVHVVVDEVGPEAERLGLTRSALQAEVEQRLRQAGLRVFTPGDALASAGRPTLHLRVTLLKVQGAPPIRVYSVDLTLRQEIRLVRDRAIESFSTTWSDTRAVGAVEPGRTAMVRDAVRTKVDQFLQAWQTVNVDQ
jgi:hypothetical protein